MNTSDKYIVVERVAEEEKKGFQTVEAQDSFVYKGRVYVLPEMPVYLGSRQIAIGDVVVFAKYSPDTHDITLNEKKVKFVKIEDILARIDI